MRRQLAALHHVTRSREGKSAGIAPEKRQCPQLVITAMWGNLGMS